MQVTKQYFDFALAKLKNELKSELKTELKTELKDELVPLITADVTENVTKNVTNSIAEKLQPQFDDIQRQFGEIRMYIREVTDEILLAIGTDLSEQQQQVSSLDQRTNRLEVRMTVVEKAIAKSNC